MDESDAREWLRDEARVRPEVIARLESKLAEQEVFVVRDLVLLREGGLLETVFDKFVTRRKVEDALDRHAQQSPQQPGGGGEGGGGDGGGGEGGGGEGGGGVGGGGEGGGGEGGGG